MRVEFAEVQAQDVPVRVMRHPMSEDVAERASAEHTLSLGGRDRVDEKLALGEQPRRLGETELGGSFRRAWSRA
jgi:hypothetical protein